MSPRAARQQLTNCTTPRTTRLSGPWKSRQRSSFVPVDRNLHKGYLCQACTAGTFLNASSAESVGEGERQQTTHVQYQPFKTGPWFSFNWRYDSGQVAGAVPCAGCGGNGPNGSNSIVDVSGLTPDQQYQAGLFCGSVRAT